MAPLQAVSLPAHWHAFLPQRKGTEAKGESEIYYAASSTHYNRFPAEMFFYKGISGISKHGNVPFETF